MKKFFVFSVILLALALFGFSEVHAGTHNKTATSQPASITSGLSGKVVETMNGGGYTYILLDTGKKKIWVAIPNAKVIKGQIVNLMPGVDMGHFESRALKRKFDNIVFSGGLQHEQSHQEMKSPGSTGSVVTPMEKIKVEKAKGSNAYSIAEIYKKLGSLDRHKVVVRGKVVKVSEAIMGRNWIHLQDGSGNVKHGNYELVVTSKDLPKPGQTVTISGTLHKDRDFGMGYKYKAIVEEATINKK